MLDKSELIIKDTSSKLLFGIYEELQENNRLLSELLNKDSKPVLTVEVADEEKREEYKPIKESKPVVAKNSTTTAPKKPSSTRRTPTKSTSVKSSVAKK